MGGRGVSFDVIVAGASSVHKKVKGESVHKKLKSDLIRDRSEHIT